jgi:hypothetical protein
MAYDANAHLLAFYKDRVRVGQDLLDTALQRRNANRDRLKAGLEKDGDPKPTEFVSQGSYAMETMIQSESEASDIDDGAVFSKESLKGDRAGDKAPADAKEMVRKAVSLNAGFKTAPEIRRNCVRVFYNDGFHVDIPVYRTWEENGVTHKQLASTDWVDSAPEDITEWFRGIVGKSPDTADGRQLRRVVRLLKFWSKSRLTWTMPSGFVLTVLVDESYPTAGWENRDDMALLQVMRSIHNQRQFSQSVYRPVAPRDEITNDRTRTHVSNMVTQLTPAINELSKLERADCDELMALKALKTVFFTDFWDDRITELEKGDGGGGGNGKGGVPPQPKTPIDKRGGTGQYA